MRGLGFLRLGSGMEKQRSRVIRCESEVDGHAVRYLADRIELADGQTHSVETLTRVVKFKDLFYGEVNITRAKLIQMVDNFKANTYGQEIMIDVSHRPSEGSAGTIERLFVERNRLRAEINWTPYGVDAVKNRGFRYFSAEFDENYQDPETGKDHGPTLLGAGLTTRPRVKKLDPVSLKLSFDIDEEDPFVVSPRMERLLSEEITDMWEELLKKLKKVLSEDHKLRTDLVTQVASGFETAVKNITDEGQAKALMESFASTGKLLAEQTKAIPAEQTIKLDFSGLETALNAGGGPGGGMTQEQVLQLMEDQSKRLAEEQEKTKAKREELVKKFNDALEAAEGLKILSEDERTTLGEAAELITADMTEDHVTRLAENQIKLGDQMAVSKKLSGMGYQVQGGVHITVDESNGIKSLQETIDRRLGILDMPESKRYERTGGTLLEINKKLAEKVLDQYDAEHGAQLLAESKMLSGGDGVVSDAAVPASYERTVIREALYSTVGLNFVDVNTLPFASSHIIPYSYRDGTATGRDGTRKYEGQSIGRGGIIQTSETAYLLPQKLAFEVSDELRYLTSNGQLAWDALAENQRNASRIISEDSEQLIANELQMASDEYGATAVSGEDLELQADGAKTIFVLAHFPVCHPRKVYDLQGSQVGSTVNPITVSYNSVALSEYDGTGTQAAGTYYSLDYNLGEITLVDESGAVQTPANGTAYTISYSYATNAYSFDTDLGTDTADVRWNDFLYRFGLRKAVIEDDRYHMANMSLMRGAVAAAIEQAKNFGANFKRPGTDLAADGNVGRIKDVPTFKVPAPSLYMGDQRVIIGERGVTRWRMCKPWTMGQLQDQKDANGRFTGKKEAYGDQFVICHTPTQLKRALTSIVLYSATARVAR